MRPSGVIHIDLATAFLSKTAREANILGIRVRLYGLAVGANDEPNNKLGEKKEIRASYCSLLERRFARALRTVGKNFFGICRHESSGTSANRKPRTWELPALVEIGPDTAKPERVPDLENPRAAFSQLRGAWPSSARGQGFSEFLVQVGADPASPDQLALGRAGVQRRIPRSLGLSFATPTPPDAWMQSNRRWCWGCIGAAPLQPWLLRTGTCAWTASD